MTTSKLIAVFLSCFVAATLTVSVARAQSQVGVQESEPVCTLYAVEIKTGPAWDSSKPAHEQPYFREHSANLKRLRDQGSLILGARYSDKGLIVLCASSEQDAHGMMQPDPSIQNRTFAYELHEFNVFYSGAVQAKPRRQ